MNLQDILMAKTHSQEANESKGFHFTLHFDIYKNHQASIPYFHTEDRSITFPVMN